MQSRPRGSLPSRARPGLPGRVSRGAGGLESEGPGPEPQAARGPAPPGVLLQGSDPQNSPGAPLSLLLHGDRWPEKVRAEKGCEDAVQAESSGKARAPRNLNTEVNESSALERAESNYLLVSSAAAEEEREAKLMRHLPWVSLWKAQFSGSSWGSYFFLLQSIFTYFIYNK